MARAASGRAAAEKRYDLAPRQLIELHSISPARSDCRVSNREEQPAGVGTTVQRRRVLAHVRHFAGETKRGCSRVFLKRWKQNADLGVLPCHSGSYTELYGIRRES